jgi:hypothetical protein
MAGSLRNGIHSISAAIGSLTSAASINIQSHRGIPDVDGTTALW